ncbi:pilus assembly protein CpaF [Kineothrix alysoides]|uniref:Pilus assembly protein CpaF n=1 Tax=Kineothrix alysoides TaxID=1469948 RepID=A0A4R1QX33_9FIRM|nr:pilus assembly protein CpaF [Kineothrix alysoides]
MEIVNIHEMAGFIRKNMVIRTFPEILKDVQEYISKNFASVLRDNPDENKELIQSYIAKYLEENQVGVEGMELTELCELLYGEMTGFSFLTKYLYRDDVEEININQWRDVKITYSTGEILQAKESFNSASHAVDVIRRLLHKSGMIFDNAQTIVVGHLNNKIRITVMGDGVIDKEKGLAVSIRIVNPKKLTKEEFVRFGTATAEMLDLLSLCFIHGVSMCITGATSSGKTTLMSWILGEVPYNKRIVTIEQGCREFDLTVEDEEGNVLNNVVHLVTRFSDDPRQNIDMVKLLEITLTINPDCISVAEMKGGESMQAINAANTGHAVITTTHANSCEDTYYRMVTLCKQEQPGMDDSTLQNLATKAFPIVAFTKRLEDNSRRIMEMIECETLSDGKCRMRTLYRFNITDNIMVDGKPKIIGHYEKVENLSEGLQKRLRENGLPLKMQEQLLAKK